MKFRLLALCFGLFCPTRAQIWGGNWGFGPSCVSSCFSFDYPMSSSDWSSYCATPTSLSNCVSTACSSVNSAYAIASSVQSSMCSAYYSNCYSMPQSCSDWPFSGEMSMGWGWGGMGGNGWYTVTGSDGHTSGLTTRTVVVTTTASGTGGTVVATITTTQTATLVAAAAGTGTTTAAATSSKTSNGAARLGIASNGVGALIAAVLGAVIAIQVEINLIF